MASPRTIGARVYLNEEEISAIHALRDEIGLSESAAIRYLMVRGLKSLRKQEHDTSEEEAYLLHTLTEPGERNHSPRALRSA